KGSSRDPQPGTGNATRDVARSAGVQVIEAPGTAPQGTFAAPTVHAPAYVNASTVTAVPIVVGGPAGFTALVTVSDGTHVVSTSGVIGGTGQLTLPFNLTPLNDGTLTVTASLTSPGGATSAPVTTSTVKDTGVPAAPTIVAPASVDATTALTFTVTIT